MINKIKYGFGDCIISESAKRKKSLTNIVGVSFGVVKQTQNPNSGQRVGLVAEEG